MRTKVGSNSTEGRMQESGHTRQYSCFDTASCVKVATWNALTRLCYRDDSNVQWMDRNCTSSSARGM
jgi:hypothetical protein